jgi:hypothetical protein
MNEVKRLEEVIDSYLEDSKLTQEEILRILWELSGWREKVLKVFLSEKEEAILDTIWERVLERRKEEWKLIAEFTEVEVWLVTKIWFAPEEVYRRAVNLQEMKNLVYREIFWKLWELKIGIFSWINVEFTDEIRNFIFDLEQTQAETWRKLIDNIRDRIMQEVIKVVSEYYESKQWYFVYVKDKWIYFTDRKYSDESAYWFEDLVIWEEFILKLKPWHSWDVICNKLFGLRKDNLKNGPAQ